MTLTFPSVTLYHPHFCKAKPFGSSAPPNVQFHLRPHKDTAEELPPLTTHFLSCMSCMPAWRLARHIINTLPEVQTAVRAAVRRGDVDGDAESIDLPASSLVELLCQDKVGWRRGKKEQAQVLQCALLVVQGAVSHVLRGPPDFASRCGAWPSCSTSRRGYGAAARTSC